MTIATTTPRRNGVLIVAGLMILIVALWIGMVIVGDTQKQYEECLKVQTVEYCEANYTLK